MVRIECYKASCVRIKVPRPVVVEPCVTIELLAREEKTVLCGAGLALQRPVVVKFLCFTLVLALKGDTVQN